MMANQVLQLGKHASGFCNLLSSPAIRIRTLCTAATPNSHEKLAVNHLSISAPAPIPQRSSSPLLLVPPTATTDTTYPENYYHFFSLADKYVEPMIRRITKDTTKKNKLVPSDQGHWVGSSHGWLAFQDPTDLSIYFVNPLMQSHHQYRLPPIPNNPPVDPVYTDHEGPSYVHKIALSGPPTNQDMYTASVIYGPRRNLAFYTHTPSKLSKGENWENKWVQSDGRVHGDVERDIGVNSDYSDVIYSKKDGNFYAIQNPQVKPGKKVTDYTYCLKTYNKRYGMFAFRIRYPNFEIDSSTWWLENPIWKQNMVEKRYLVESSSSADHVDHHCSDDDGEEDGKKKKKKKKTVKANLYLVCRYVCRGINSDGIFRAAAGHEQDEDRSTYLTQRFIVYKLDEDQKKWLRVPKWGHQSFFVGMNESFSVSDVEIGNQFPELVGDRVYFTDDVFDKMNPDSMSGGGGGGHDIGAYQAGDGRCRIINYTTSSNNMDGIKPPPIWVDVVNSKPSPLWN